MNLNNEDKELNNENNENHALNNENVVKIINDTIKSVLQMSSKEQRDSRTPDNAADFKTASCKEGPVLVYPKYRDKKTMDIPETRISEQELKQIFIASLGGSKINCFYSVETPSDKTYNFKSEIPKIDPDGQSALFDLSLYDKNKEIFSHLEFKCGNVDEFCITKDLLKLSAEPGKGKGKNYFIHIINGFDGRTLKSLTKKYVGELPTENEDEQTLYETIREGLSKRIIIYLLVVRNQIKDYGGSKDIPVSGFFKLVYQNNDLNWKSSWYRYNENNNEFEPCIPQG